MAAPTQLLPSDLNFKRQLFCSRSSVLFHVNVHGRPYALKVHDRRGLRQYYDPADDREIDFHVCEATAYRRLQQHGLCRDGIVPRFYGAFDKLDPKLYQPHLRMFLKDEYPPSAILLEYIPNIQQLHWTNYTKERMGNFVNGLEQIHHARVEHSDVQLRNMTVVDGDPERAIWIDFDRAQTLDGDDVTEDQKEWMAFEKALVAEMADFMLCILVTLHAERLRLLTVGSIP